MVHNSGQAWIESFLTPILLRIILQHHNSHIQFCIFIRVLLLALLYFIISYFFQTVSSATPPT
jgi:phosphotransferase system  glucose/maltose/N-acetylglucosamine-specific IIC component